MFSPDPKPLEHKKSPAVLLIPCMSEDLTMGGKWGCVGWLETEGSWPAVFMSAVTSGAERRVWLFS